MTNQDEPSGGMTLAEFRRSFFYWDTVGADDGRATRVVALGDVGGFTVTRSGQRGENALLGTFDAANRLRMSPQTLESLQDRGEGPAFVSIGTRGVVRYEPKALEEWHTSRQRCFIGLFKESSRGAFGRDDTMSKFKSRKLLRAEWWDDRARFKDRGNRVMLDGVWFWDVVVPEESAFRKWQDKQGITPTGKTNVEKIVGDEWAKLAPEYTEKQWVRGTKNEILQILEDKLPSVNPASIARYMQKEWKPKI